MSTELGLRKALIWAARELETKGFLPGCSGNLSARLDDKHILITPRGKKKGSLKTSDLVQVSLDGHTVQGIHKPSTEMQMHLTIYRSCKDAQTVIHAHPPFATAYAAAGVKLNHSALPETMEQLGKVPLIPYAQSSTQELSKQLEPYLARHHCFLLSNHGAVVYGINTDAAFYDLENLEFVSKVSLLSSLIGQPTATPERK